MYIHINNLPWFSFCFRTVNRLAGLLHLHITLFSSPFSDGLGVGILWFMLLLVLGNLGPRFVGIWTLFTVGGGTNSLGRLWKSCRGILVCVEFPIPFLLFLEKSTFDSEFWGLWLPDTFLTEEILICNDSRKVLSQPPKQPIYGGGYKWLKELFLHSNSSFL